MTKSWTLLLVWLGVCALVIWFNHGAHRNDDDDSESFV